jgi:hypothetical protein
MARKTDQTKLDRLKAAIRENPGHRAGHYARRLGRDNKSVMRALPQLEERGDLLAEDDNGRLSWFGRRRS